MPKYEKVVFVTKLYGRLAVGDFTYLHEKDFFLENICVLWKIALTYAFKVKTVNDAVFQWWCRGIMPWYFVGKALLIIVSRKPYVWCHCTQAGFMHVKTALLTGPTVLKCLNKAYLTIHRY